LYRTKTTWEKLDANSLVKDSKKKECWFPKKIELEHIPNELQPGKGYTAAEIVGIWQEAPADILSRGEFPKEIAIDLELAPPGDEFSSLLTQLKYKLMREQGTVRDSLWPYR